MKINPTLFLLFLLGMMAWSMDRNAKSEIPQSMEMQGHRGARGEFPEHTLAGFEGALRAGVDTIECDVHYTADHRFVVFHDHQILPENTKGETARLNEGKWIYQLSSETLTQMDIGSWNREKFPGQKPVGIVNPLLLDEWLGNLQALAKNNTKWSSVRFNIEVKLAPKSPHFEKMETLVANLLEILEKTGIANRCTLQSFSMEAIAEVNRQSNRIQTAALFSPNRKEQTMLKAGLPANRSKIIETTLQVGADIISPHFIYCSKSFIQDCHAKGLKVIPWTVNDEKWVSKLIQYQVDGIITDYPTRLVPFVQSITQDP